MKNWKGARKAIHFVYLATNKSSNCSRSDVNVRAQLLRKNYSRNFSSIITWIQLVFPTVMTVVYSLFCLCFR